jgi:hypothetical protein
LSIRTIDILINKPHAARYAKMLLFLLIPCIGPYFIYNSLQAGAILRINYSSGKKHFFPLKEIARENRLNEFKSLMAGKLGTKMRVSIGNT